MPLVLLRLARFGLGLDDAVHYHLSALPSFERALWSDFLHSRPQPHRRASVACVGLTRPATADHAPPIAASGADALIRKDGFHEVQRDERVFAAEVARADAQWMVDTREGRVDARHAVVALGPWSADFLELFGYRAAMIAKRGCRQYFRIDRAPSRPIHDVETSVLYRPMRAGLRVTSGAESARIDAPPTPVQLRYGVRRGREALDSARRRSPSRGSGCVPA